MDPRIVYRIVDANYNRAREGLRVIEEYCRFALNHAGLSGQAKQIRHELCTLVARLDRNRRLGGRDTRADVGVDLRVDGQCVRVDLEDALVAAAQRTTEALRVLTETLQGSRPDLAGSLESLRYRCYNLERDIAVEGVPAARFAAVRLYVIVSTQDAERLLRQVDQCAQGGADCVQWRPKGLPDRDLWETGRRFVDRCRQAGVLSILNDRVDIAVACGADGVHLGREDLPVSAARRLQATPLIIGSTTHADDELEAACRQRPTYVALGPAFPSVTKPELAAAGLDYVRRALPRLAADGLGHAVIGGITLDNVGDVLAAGARAIVVCSAVTQAADPTAACRAFKEVLDAA